MEEQNERRVETITAHLTSSKSEVLPEDELQKLPLPPIVALKEGQLFPTYPEVLETSKRVGGVFTYVLGNNKRMTFVTDKAAYRHVFFVRDNKDVNLDSAKLAYHWFGIQKELARDYTRPSLDKTREAMAYANMLQANDKVGEYAWRKMSDMPAEGVGELWDIAMLTFVPVVRHLFGTETFPDEKKCPMIAQTLWDYDSDFKKVANGMPRKWFPEMEKLAQELCGHFEKSIDQGLHLRPDANINCPVLKARLSVIPEGKFSAKEKARFIFSVFWASQGNTIPGTFWLLAHIASNERVRKRLAKELSDRYKNKKPGNEGFYRFEDCQYLQACAKETLRLKVANVTLRNVLNDIAVETTNGAKFRVPRGDEITVSSYVQHHDDRVYERPDEFFPERWLEENGGSKYTDFDWFPFGAGTNKCSGRHLAQLELATIAGLLFTMYDVTPKDTLPVEEWGNCVAMVSPGSKDFKYSFRRII